MPGRAGSALATLQINAGSFYEVPESRNSTSSYSNTNQLFHHEPANRNSGKRSSPANKQRRLSAPAISIVENDDEGEHLEKELPRSARQATEDSMIRADGKSSSRSSSPTSGGRHRRRRHSDTGHYGQAGIFCSEQSGDGEQSQSAQLWDLREAGLEGVKHHASASVESLDVQPNSSSPSVPRNAANELNNTRRWTESTMDATTTVTSSSDYFCDAFAHERKTIRHVMSSPKFDFSIGVVIVGNCFTIGLEQSWELQGIDTSVLKWMEHGFLLIYIFELGLRFFAFRLSCLQDNWVKFDTFLVLVGITTGWVLPPIMGQIDALGPLMILRTARLMRLARTVRLLIKFRELWMLVRGLLNSASTMVYTLIMLFIIIYIFSCMAIELITNHSLARGPDADPEFKAFVDENFGSLPLTMVTLMQFASLDNMNLLYMPLIKKSWWLVFFFVAIILVISIVLMNLITAVVVNSALEQAMSDKEAMKAQEDKRRKKLMRDLRRMFHHLDDDGSGQVSREEMAQMRDEDKTLLYNILGMSDPLEVFMQLDVDGSGLLEIDEFCDGIWQVAISKAPIEIKRLEKQVNSLKNSVIESVSTQNSIYEMLDTVLSILNAQTAPRHRVDDTNEPEPKYRETSRPTTTRIPDRAESLGLQFMESWVGWKDGVTSDVAGLKDAFSILSQEISNQLKHTLIEVRCADPRSTVISLGEDFPTLASLDSHKQASTPLSLPAEASLPVPHWAQDLRAELLRTAECVKLMLGEMQKKSKCPNTQSSPHSPEAARQVSDPLSVMSSLWRPTTKPASPRS